MSVLVKPVSESPLTSHGLQAGHGHEAVWRLVDPAKFRALRERLALSRFGERKLRGTPFYRSYPFSSGVNIFQADGRGLVDHQLRIFYNRIPKAANTSLVLTLCNTRFGRDNGLTTRRAKKIFPRPSQLSAVQLSNFDEYCKFTFVRNPYSRILSAYLSKIARGHNVPLELANHSPPSFQAFCHYLNDGGLFENAHWAPQTSLLLLPMAKFDFIGRVESFERDTEHLLSLIGVQSARDLIVRHSNFPTSASGKIDQYYTRATKNLIAKLYRDDFCAFEYAVQ